MTGTRPATDLCFEEILRDHSRGKLLSRARRLGEWVATRRGATPAYDPSTPTNIEKNTQ